MAQPTATSVAKINNVNIIVIENGEKRVAIRPICDALGIAYQSQIERLKNDPILSSTVTLNVTVGADEKQREMLTIPFKYVFGWLFRIDSRNVKPEAQDAVLKYQVACYDALYNHFQELDQYLKDRQAMAEAKWDEVEKARDDFKEAKNKLDLLKEEFKNARAMTFEIWKAMKAQTSLEFPTDTQPVAVLPDTIN